MTDRQFNLAYVVAFAICVALILGLSAATAPPTPRPVAAPVTNALYTVVVWWNAHTNADHYRAFVGEANSLNPKRFDLPTNWFAVQLPAGQCQVTLFAMRGPMDNWTHVSPPVYQTFVVPLKHDSFVTVATDAAAFDSTNWHEVASVVLTNPTLPMEKFRSRISRSNTPP